MKNKQQPSFKAEQQGFLASVKKSVSENPGTMLRTVAGVAFLVYFFFEQKRMEKEQTDDAEKLSIVSWNGLLNEQGKQFQLQINRQVPNDPSKTGTRAKKSTVFVLQFAGDMSASQVITWYANVLS
jgi:hypothetical protein